MQLNIIPLLAQVFLHAAEYLPTAGTSISKTSPRSSLA
jgi:hypothetical protein